MEEYKAIKATMEELKKILSQARYCLNSGNYEDIEFADKHMVDAYECVYELSELLEPIMKSNQLAYMFESITKKEEDEEDENP